MKVAISGAGVAGPAFAHWMHRAGHEVTLIEAAPHFRTGGYVIDFWGLGYTIAERMGIEADIRKVGYQVREVRAVGADGRVRARLGVDPIRRATHDRYTTVARGDLAEVIYRTIENDVETLYSDTITSLDNQPDGVRLTFRNAQPRDFDMVIGADGLHSTVRSLAFGPESWYAYYLGCQVAACVLTGYRPRDDDVYVTYNLPGRQVGRFAMNGDRTLVLFIFRSENPYIPHDLHSCKALVRNHFADAGWETPGILAALDDVDDLYVDVVSQIRMPEWSVGRVALIGDAAACVSLLAGEGTGLALVESYVLAGELARAGNDITRAFDAYEARLRDFIEQKQNGATKFISFFSAETRLGIAVRNALLHAMNLPFVGDVAMKRALRDDVDVPDYRL
ncbi:FAD-binding domain [Mycolicibacterium sp. 120270]|uniref:FAD-binding domain n=1 Tax=Mycolicibacterium sp. 120270 TaxID=3090600 RepID=UPI00299D3D28|nr:FAD-binding domain [Mycolicibacterium sp. 120270]MDX1883365.1 FAD-binding domain [Mycolicibacterium sp. 120270]